MRIFTMMIFLSLILGIGLSGVAFAASDNSPSQICKANDDFGVSHDTCVVCIAQGFPEITSPTCTCKAYEDGGLLEFFGFSSLGDCISCLQTGKDCPEI